MFNPSFFRKNPIKKLYIFIATMLFLTSCKNYNFNDLNSSLNEEKSKELNSIFEEKDLIEVIDSSLDSIEVRLSEITPSSNDAMQNIAFVKSETKLIKYVIISYIKLCYERERRYNIDNYDHESSSNKKLIDDLNEINNEYSNILDEIELDFWSLEDNINTSTDDSIISSDEVVSIVDDISSIRDFIQKSLPYHY